MSGALLRLDEVTGRRGGRLLFEGLNLTLRGGQAMIVRGPNGSGKSSLIRIAAGLLRPAAGRVERAPAELADDNLALDARLPLRAALDFWAKLDGVSALPGLEAMGIGALADVPVRMLSAGQRKRAALARMVASNAPLWLLDEPVNALDAEGVARLEKALAAHRIRGGAVLAATHQPLGLPGAKELVLG